MLLLCFAQNVSSANSSDDRNLYEIDNEYVDSILKYADSPTVETEKLIDEAEKEKNLQNLFTIRFSLSKWYAEKQDFTSAFDNAWETLKIAESLADTLLIARSTSNLGNLFNFFTKMDEAIDFVHESNKLYKYLFASGKVDYQKLISSYYQMVLLYRWFDSTDIALAYIDTCYTLSYNFNQSEIDRGYITGAKASIYTMMGKADSSLALLRETEDLFKNLPVKQIKKQRFLIMIYMHLGDAYLSLEQYSPAITYYKKSLEYIDLFDHHKGNRVPAYERLSQAQMKAGLFEDAYNSLKISNDLNNKYFSSRSSSNANLIAINNKYKDIVGKQRVELLEKQRDLLISRGIIGIILIALIIGVFLYRNKIQKQKLKKRNEEIQKEKKQSDNLLEHRNKELTANTLKFIEKEELLNKLVKHLKLVSPNNGEINALLQSTKSGSKVLWEEFNTRFISVNTDFYRNLGTKFPDLSPTELKHCALIKLNFSAKEMSQLLGISLTGINVARHRLRKKLGLTRDVNLTKFISEI